MENTLDYMGHQWLQMKNGLLIFGINDAGLEELTEITELSFPAEDEEVEAEDVIGEINTDQGPLNIYTPVSGKIVEINDAVVENPDLIIDDPYGDGWLFKLEPEDDITLAEIAASVDDEEEEDDEDEVRPKRSKKSRDEDDEE